MLGFLKSKPFYKNKTREEYIEWFSNAKYWNKLNSKIINAIVDKFIGDPPSFNVFIQISESCNLVSNNFIPLSQVSDDHEDILLLSFALTLYNTGVRFRDQFIEKMNAGETEKELSGLIYLSQSSFESALKLNQYLFGAYFSLAYLKGLLNKNDEGIIYCNKALEKIKILESMPHDKLTSMQLASFNDVAFYNEKFTELTKQLKAQQETEGSNKGFGDQFAERPVLSEDTLKRLREAGLNPDEMTNEQLAAFEGWENVKKSHWLSKWLSYASIFLGLIAIINLLTLDFGGFIFFGVFSLLLMYVAYRIQRRVTLKKFNEASSSRKKPVIENKPPHSPKKRILIADDEENIRELYKEELQEEGYDVETASDGIEALEMLANKGPFDLVTTCIRMPRMDGINLVRKIKEKYLNTPVIIVTSYSEYKEDVNTWAADAYIVKSHDLAELKDTIKKILSPEADLVNKLPQNTSIDKALPIMCVTNEYLWRDYLLDLDKSLKFKMQKLMENNERVYDVLCFEKPTGEEVNLYFNISSFYGKGEDIFVPPVLNMPPHSTQFTLHDLCTPEKWLTDIVTDKDIKIIFQPYSSEMISMYVVLWRNQEMIEITPIRAYDKETDLPILHSYNFWSLMLVHQLQHILDNHDVATTETAVKADYYKPLIGTDCIRFHPLPSFNFSNDLINYTFYIHRPNAFESNAEVSAFGASLRLCFSRGLFTLQEIEQSIIQSEIDIVTRKMLIDMANFAFKEVQIGKESISLG